MIEDIKDQILTNGFAIIEDVFTPRQIDLILDCIAKTDSERPTFRKTNDLFAIRQFLKEVPGVRELVLTHRLYSIVTELFANNYSAIKSIFFDKPERSNWFVAYHQDLTISVDKRMEIEGYGPWTVKQNQFAVQPPPDILKNNFTIRIHLDDTDENNGALKVIPGSHLKGICRPENIDCTNEQETICKIKKGGIMIMRPLLLHCSGRTINNNRRRVIHIEFTNTSLPKGLVWSELVKWGLIQESS